MKKNKNKKKRKVLRKVLLVILLILLIAGGVFAYKVYKNGGGMSGMLATMVGHNENTKKNLGEFRCLILGISTDQKDVDLTDTIIVASYNPNTQKATLLSIPRDTYTGKNPSKATAYEKINAMYSRKHRPDETLKAVNDITGLNIEYYVVVKTEALIKLVDVIGGVTFNVPINMDYDDSSQNLAIHLKAGEQKLDGDKAEQLVRFRHNNNGTSYPEDYGDNDIGRMRTQREFIMQVVKQTAKPENIFKIGQILDVAKEYVITNIDFDVAKDYVPYAVEFNTDDLLTEVLPGTPSNKNASGTWVYIHDAKKTKTLIEELFVNRDKTEEETTNTTESNTISTNSTSTTSTTATKKDSIKIEVLNGSGSSTNLQTVVSKLEKAGFKVTKKGETNSTSKTTIINKKEIKDNYVTEIKNAVGMGITQNSQSTSSKVDLTIIIGKDYK
ncbi:MAG: LCP family protein [Clostridia bacterium]|nr:LCP family protein [Clostridia bacterium]